MRLGGPDGWDEDGGASALPARSLLRAGAARAGAGDAALILAFAISSRGTALALFRGPELVRAQSVPHVATEPTRPAAEKHAALREAARAFLRAAAVDAGALGAIAVHAETPRAVESGTYRVDDALLRDCDARGGDLAAGVAHDLACEWSCPAFAVDPGCVAERHLGAEGADCDGSIFSMRSAARRHAIAVERALESLRLVLVHLGHAVSACVHAAARVGEVHVVLPSRAAAELCDALARAEAGDTRAAGVVHGAGSRIAQVVGGLATVLEGEVDAVLVTGALERTAPVLAEICRRVEWIAPVFLYRDEDRLVALAHGASAVLRGAEPLKKYA